jgi:hypothetical protein
MRGWKLAAAAGLVLADAASPVLAQNHEGRVPFRTDVQQAMADAQSQGKPIWFLATADW